MSLYPSDQSGGHPAGEYLEPLEPGHHLIGERRRKREPGQALLNDDSRPLHTSLVPRRKPISPFRQTPQIEKGATLIVAHVGVFPGVRQLVHIDPLGVYGADRDPHHVIGDGESAVGIATTARLTGEREFETRKL
jgi:hypothetical protein